jgi:hypothetical protein
MSDARQDKWVRMKNEAVLCLFAALDDEVPHDADKLAAQIPVLIRLSDMLHAVSRIEGCVGYAQYHHAKRMAVAVDEAIGNLRRLEHLRDILKRVQSG